MNVNFANATAAYGKTNLPGAGMDARDSGKPSFTSALSGYLKSGVETLQKAEQTSMLALQNKADLTDVITAIGQAETTLQAVVTVRDRVIGGYQEIMRMPV